MIPIKPTTPHGLVSTAAQLLVSETHKTGRKQTCGYSQVSLLGVPKL